MTTLTFEYSSVHGALAAAYTCGALAAEFGPEHVRVSLALDAEERGDVVPLLAEIPMAHAERYRYDTRLLGVVHDGDGPAWALLTSHVNLARKSPLLVRALSAVLQARPHRCPVLDSSIQESYSSWAADFPLRAAHILVTEDFVVGSLPLAA
ncbi:hypothetical protein ACSMXN_21615 [Jatrophihabitans sp. DSM 45814]